MEKTNKSDFAAGIVKSTIGAVPAVGPFLSEVITSLIPKQRIDRIQSLLEKVEQRVKLLESPNIQLKLQKPKYIDLLEDGIFQAVRAISNERIEYISNLISYGLTTEEKDCIRAKKLLQLLDSINDAEVLFLIYYNRTEIHDDNGYYENHHEVLAPVGAHMGSPIEEVEEEAIQKSYKMHLAEIGLLQERHKKPRRDEFPEFDIKTGKIKASGYDLTPLGRVLLKYMGEKTIYNRD